MLRTGTILILIKLYIALNFEMFTVMGSICKRLNNTCRSRTINILRDAYSFDVCIHNCAV